MNQIITPFWTNKLSKIIYIFNFRNKLINLIIYIAINFNLLNLLSNTDFLLLRFCPLGIPYNYASPN